MGSHRLGATVLAVTFSLFFETVAAPQALAGSWDWATGPSLADKKRVAQKQEGNDWSVDLNLYLWVAGTNGTVGIPPTGDIPVSTTFSDLRSKLRAGFAGIIDIRYRRWHIISDNGWVQLKDTQAISLTGLPLYDTANVKLDAALGTAGVAYELPLDTNFALDLYLAARWWHMSTEANLSGQAPNLSGEATKTWADAVVGARLRYAITDKWRVALSGDVGAGAADIDWMAYGGLTYMFNRYVGATAGYRIVGVDYSDRGFQYDVKMHGLLVGLNLAY